MPGEGDIGWRSWKFSADGLLETPIYHMGQGHHRWPESYTALWNSGTATAVCSVSGGTRECRSPYGGGQAPCFTSGVIQCGLYACVSFDEMVDWGYGPHRNKQFSGEVLLTGKRRLK